MKLSDYIRETGEAEVAQRATKAGSVTVTVRAVQSWRYGARRPNPDAARALVESSDGLLTWADIYAPVDAA